MQKRDRSLSLGCWDHMLLQMALLLLLLPPPPPSRLL
jgi:hypothetical protein